MNTQTHVVTLEMVTCCKCGVVFGIVASHLKTIKSSETTFYCPNGHAQWFGPSQESILTQKLANAERGEKWWKEEAERNGRRLSATRGVVTKLKKAFANGSCPYCGKKFKELEEHMLHVHPEFVKEQNPNSHHTED